METPTPPTSPSSSGRGAPVPDSNRPDPSRANHTELHLDQNAMSTPRLHRLAVLLCALAASPAHAEDCNGNGVDDALDIAFGTSLDENGDGIPDECQRVASCDDCDGDGIVDAEQQAAKSGLAGEYWITQAAGTFTERVLSRIDPNVEFQWSGGSPDPSIPNDNFTVRWTGTITAPASGSYTFGTTTDAGGESGVHEGETSPEVDLAAGRKDVVRAEVKRGTDGRTVTVLVIAFIMAAEGQQDLPDALPFPRVGRVGHVGGPEGVVHGRPGASAADDAAAPGLRGIPSSSFSGLAWLANADAKLSGQLRGISLSYV